MNLSQWIISPCPGTASKSSRELSWIYIPTCQVCSAGPWRDPDHTVFPGLAVPQELWAGCLCCSVIMEDSYSLNIFTTLCLTQGQEKLFSLLHTRAWPVFTMQMFPLFPHLLVIEKSEPFLALSGLALTGETWVPFEALEFYHETSFHCMENV